MLNPGGAQWEIVRYNCPPLGEKPGTGKPKTSGGTAYAVTAISTASSPSSNVPMHCPICPTAAPCIWHYNLSHCMQLKHPAISLALYKLLWQITNTEKSQLKEIWANCHKQKKMCKSRAMGTSGLVISNAHSSCLTLQQVLK